MMSTTSFSVATGIYLEYWASQALDADRCLFPDAALQLIVFTDRARDAHRLSSTLGRASVTVVEVEPMGWPDATMRRYELISSVASEVQGDLLIHLDADMRIPGIVGPGLDPSTWLGGIALVRHPGYFRVDSLARRLVTRPGLARRDLESMLKTERGLGTWEQSPRSRAYVPPRRRKIYACGGVWMGQREALLSMCEILADLTTQDLADGIVARWHDESYLNWYASHRSVSFLNPSYCHVASYRDLAHFPALISPVEKGDQRVRNS